MRVLITGAHGFIGRNLELRLREMQQDELLLVTRQTSPDERRALLERCDAVVHLAGVNRPLDDTEFAIGNADLTSTICHELRSVGRPIPIIYASSVQAERDNPYGRSKRDAEDAVGRYGLDMDAGTAILRLVNVFGKWSRPNYNSAVATFCHNIARALPITVDDPAAVLSLVFIDDVVDAILSLLATGVRADGVVPVGPIQQITVGELAATIRSFAESRTSLTIPRVGTGLLRALYSTYVSFLPADRFAYALRRHEDSRGVFAEMLRTEDAGQISFFSAHPGVTRGGHYHHTKTEKFLVVKGTAKFGFRNIISGEYRELIVRGAEATVVETVPGWAHDIRNIGDDEMIVLLWANEVFDPQRPDTVAAPVRG